MVTSPIETVAPRRVRVPLPVLVSETVPAPAARTPAYVVVVLLPPR